MKSKMILGQRSWRLASTTVEAYVTERGGHLGPVTFDRRGRKLRPYSVAPWAEERLAASQPPVIRVLRGDFFCLPFGGNMTPFRRERHPAHGETANAKWKLESLGDQCLHVSLQTHIRNGRVDKRITLRDGHNAVYCQHVISGMRGPMNLGHHAMLNFQTEGTVSTSGFVHGQVVPGMFEKPEERGYQSLQPGAVFDSLEKVPMLSGGLADLSRYPARRGYEDVVMLVGDAVSPFAWTAVTFPQQRYAWFALKDPRVLRQTIFWMSNGGRHYPPWNGRHVNVMGLEEVTAYFHFGLSESARNNPLTAKGHPTCLQLDPKRDTLVNYIMAVAALPAGFDKVVAIEASDQRSITLSAASGKRVKVPVDVGFLNRKEGIR